ncbi:hypothetical protein, partial [Hymenobacter persicinus]
MIATSTLLPRFTRPGSPPWKFLLLLLLLCPLVGWGQAVSITPTHDGVIANNPSWTHTNITQNTAGGYLQFTSASSPTLISPALNFTAYGTKTLTFSARTFGGTTGSSNVINVAISVNNGGSYTTLTPNAVPNSSSFSSFNYDLTSYTGTQVLVRIQDPGATNSIGVGVDNIAITGVLNTPTITSIDPTTV